MLNINQVNRTKAEQKAAAEKLINAAIERGADLQGAELEQYNGHLAKIKECESLLARHAELAAIKTTETTTETPVINREGNEVTDVRGTKEFNRNFWNYMRHGKDRLAREVLNALTIGSDGVLTPLEFDKVVVEKLQNANIMRQLATVITTQSDRKIAIENAVGVAAWAAEDAVSHNDDDSDDRTFSQVSISAYKMTRIEKVSEELLQDAFFDLPGFLGRKFGVAFGLAEEAAYVNGSGSGQPTGIIGSATAQAGAFASTSDIATDELMALYHSLKRVYRASASWVMADSTALNIRKKKDSMGQYIWQPGLQAGQPDMLLGKPVYISDFAPTIAASAKSVLFGDCSYYTIADRSPRTFLRLNELFARNGQVGFRGTQRTDGKLTLAEAVVVGVHAAS